MRFSGALALTIMLFGTTLSGCVTSERSSSDLDVDERPLVAAVSAERKAREKRLTKEIEERCQEVAEKVAEKSPDDLVLIIVDVQVDVIVGESYAEVEYYEDGVGKVFSQSRVSGVTKLRDCSKGSAVIVDYTDNEEAIDRGEQLVRTLQGSNLKMKRVVIGDDDDEKALVITSGNNPPGASSKVIDIVEKVAADDEDADYDDLFKRLRSKKKRAH